MKKPLTILPTNQLLQQIWDYLLSRPNKKGETKKPEHECLFLLGWKAGLRVSEAINFDLTLEHQQPEYKNLYLLRGKRQKDRWVYLSSEIIVKELKKRNWKPQQANRFSFLDFCKQVKSELNLPANIELAPHTLRRCFATANAINGMPLPVLQKVLGHSKISTTALYIKDSDLGNLVKFKPVWAISYFTSFSQSLVLVKSKLGFWHSLSRNSHFFLSLQIHGHRGFLGSSFEGKIAGKADFLILG